mgnify:CR=1 FL=1
MQVMHDMCVMAQTGGGVKAAERIALEQVAKGLGIPSQFICQSINEAEELD